MKNIIKRIDNNKKIDMKYEDRSRYQALRNSDKLFKNTETEVYTKDGEINIINKYRLEKLRSSLKYSKGKLTEISFYENREDYITKREKQIEVKKVKIEYIENKTKIYEITPKDYKNNLKNGIYLEYDGDRLITKGYYIDGKMEGLWKEKEKENLYKDNKIQSLLEKFKYKYQKAKTEIENFNDPIDIIKNCNNLKYLHEKIAVNNWGAFEANLVYAIHKLKNIEEIILKDNFKEINASKGIKKQNIKEKDNNKIYSTKEGRRVIKRQNVKQKEEELEL